MISERRIRLTRLSGWTLSANSQTMAMLLWDPHVGFTLRETKLCGLGYDQ